MLFRLHVTNLLRISLQVNN